MYDIWKYFQTKFDITEKENENFFFMHEDYRTSTKYFACPVMHAQLVHIHCCLSNLKFTRSNAFSRTDDDASTIILFHRYVFMSTSTALTVIQPYGLHMDLIPTIFFVLENLCRMLERKQKYSRRLGWFRICIYRHMHDQLIDLFMSAKYVLIYVEEYINHRKHYIDEKSSC